MPKQTSNQTLALELASHQTVGQPVLIMTFSVPLSRLQRPHALPQLQPPMERERLIALGAYAPKIVLIGYTAHCGGIDGINARTAILGRGGIHGLSGSKGLRERQIRCIGLHNISTTASHDDRLRSSKTTQDLLAAVVIVIHT